jgi:hypothetical protein
MKITIEGDGPGIRDACQRIANAMRRRRGGQPSPEKQYRQDQFVIRRRLLRRAYDLVRSKNEDRLLALTLARGLGGSSPITDELINIASEICSETSQQDDADLVAMGAAAHRAIT